MSGQANYSQTSEKDKQSNWLIEPIGAALDTPIAEPVIDGLVRRGEVLNVVAMAKGYKSHLAFQLAFAVATGTTWLGRKTVSGGGQVLCIDNELPRGVFGDRANAIAEALRINDTNAMDRFHSSVQFVSLRSNPLGSGDIRRQIENSPDNYALIVIDSLYRLLSVDGRSEVDPQSVTQAYSDFMAIADFKNCAVVVVCHTTKGDQSTKQAIDVAAGSAAIARNCDSQLVIRPHRKENHAVLSPITRSFAAQPDETIRLQYPIWVPADTAPALRVRATAKDIQNGQSKADAEEFILAALRKSSALSVSDIRGMTAWSLGRVKSAFKRLEDSGAVVSAIVRSKTGKRETERYSLRKEADEQSAA